MTINYTVIPLSQFLSSEVYSEDILLRAFKKFKCEKEHDLEDFLQNKAIRKEKSGVSKTYLFIDKETLTYDNIDIIGFISLASTSINLQNFSKKQRKKILGSSVENRDNLTSCPAYLIGQLGRNDAYTRRHLPGDFLLYEAISIFKNTQELVAVADLVILECRPHMYEKFYQKHDFSELPLADISDYEDFGKEMLKRYILQAFYPLEDKQDEALLIYIKSKYDDLGIEIFKKYKNDLSIDDKENTLQIISKMQKEYMEIKLIEETSDPEKLLTLCHRLSKIEFDIDEDIAKAV